MAITLQHPRSYYGGFLSHGGTPKSSISIGCSWIFHYKPSIFGYPYIVDLFMICIFIYHLNLYLSYNIYWLVVSTPLKNISQLGLSFPIYGKIKIMFQTTNQYIYIYTYIHIGSSHFSEPPLSFAKTRCLPDTTPPSDAWNSARKSERFSGGKVFRAWESVVKPMLYMVWLVVDLPL